MAHFAKLDQNNIVVQVLVIDNSDILDEHGNESEEIGIQICKKNYCKNSKWVQTSYNSNFRYKFAGIGDKFDEALNAFIAPGYLYIEEYDVFALPPKFPSWVWNQEEERYVAPIKKPVDTFRYLWNEEKLNWEIVEGSEGWRPWNAK